MSYKRSRATYEADLTAEQSPFVLFGTPLPPQDPDVRDDGSYVPLWKQELATGHADMFLSYFNTVGSKEGWTPSTFVSSRANRRKDDSKAAQQRPEDFMDEEDIADAEESKRIQTQAAFSGLGTTADDASRASGLMGLFHADGDTMGTKLLKKMGWREGQGVGPKVRRAARLDLRSDTHDAGEKHLFAPENVPMISFVRKTDHRGLGYGGEARLTPIGLPDRTSGANDSDEDDDGQSLSSIGRSKFTLSTGRKKERDKSRGGIGVGVLNDTGSDDEDPYEIGPRISYNRVIGTEKKKKKATTSINPTLKAKPTFVPSRKSILGKVALGVRKCHDGRLPLEGFVFGKEPDALTSEINAEGKYPPPKIPPDWVPSKQASQDTGATGYVSTADAAKASMLEPKARAAILGEKQLPGKSVFDFMSADARERLAAASGRADLPQARGEIPTGYALSERDRLQELLSRVPKLDKETAIAAISRGAGGNPPYADDEAKRARYISFLEYQAGFKPTPGPQPSRIKSEDWMRELQEFYNCARIFKPMTGFMASRFTTSSTIPGTGSGGETGNREMLSKPAPKPRDPAEEAAKLGMFGPMTRTVTDFYPTRLLCKRFNVKPPEHISPDEVPPAGPGQGRALLAAPEKVEVDATRNEALEGNRAGEDVFKAIFGDSDDED
ncbi:hypothetical protein N0V88_005377 [Collariella sp. IMI 366227]|nr:hypothetical protein N0V88_005377 [Collariella sp. IMI 366227]